MHNFDEISFVNDEEAIGKWAHFSTLHAQDSFDPDQAASGEGEFQEIYFLPNGQKYWIFEGWTKGSLFTHFGGDEPIIQHKYEIKTINNSKFMLLTSDASKVQVLMQTSDKKFSLYEIGRHDPIDSPFIMDEAILGTWTSIDWVENIEDFDPETLCNDTLWLKSVCFQPDGSAVRVYGNETWHDNWTQGFLIDKVKVTASAYIIKTIGHIEYLFLEWKMGNYVYGGAEPDYYVFKR